MKDRDYVQSCLIKHGYIDAAAAIADNNNGETTSIDHRNATYLWHGVANKDKRKCATAMFHINQELIRRNRNYKEQAK